MEVTMLDLSSAQDNIESEAFTPCNENVDPVFIIRESPFTVLWNTSIHFRTCYYIFIVILLFCFLDTVIVDLVENGKINLGFGVLIATFDKKAPWRGLGLWLFELSAALLFYPALRLYACIQKSSGPGSLRGTSTIGLAGLIVLQASLVGVPIWDLCINHQEWAPSGIVTFEMIRFAMKIHAMAVVCAPRCHTDKTPLPSFKHYVYFLFAPTLVYRDRYPRNNRIRWGMVLVYSLEVVAMIFIMCYLWERFIFSRWSDYGKQSTVEVGRLVHSMFTCALTGTISVLCGFYIFLHSWMNAFAEVLTFGDRLFYEDWWTSGCFAHFFRSWNRVVYFWLRTHLYRPLTPYAGRMTSTFVVLLVSAATHEVILAFTFKFFYPVLLAQIGIVFVLLPLTSTIGRRFPNTVNLLIWLGFFIGNGIFWSLLPMEHFARINCPPSENDSIFIPKSWSCPKIFFKSHWRFHYPFQNFFG